MKRSYLIAIFSLLLTIPCFAQRDFESHRVIPDWNNVKIPDGSKIGVVFDYSNTIFKGLSYEDYCDLDKDFSKDIKESESRFILRFVDLMSKLRKKSFYYSKSLENANYIMTVIPNTLADNGTFNGIVVIKDKEEKVIASFKVMNCYGGKIGSYTNLIGDGYENLAKYLVDTIQSGINRKRI